LTAHAGARGGLVLWLIAAATLLGACATYYVPAGSGRASGLAATADGLSNAAFNRLIADMDPAMLAVARRHDPALRHTDYWGRQIGWEKLDLKSVPTPGFAILDFDEARRVNALKPATFDAIRPAAPFVLPAQGVERERALHCLTQAVYFEAATEPLDGRRAVAQTVLNRLRHPGYPKSVCGVVFEGSARVTGCQFSFTCDGSLAHALVPSLWEQAQDIARQALAGYVFRDVGTATHYHADYVLPYWAPTLLKLKQIGAHIFYRWTGPSGEPRAFNRRYAGGETVVSADILNALDERTQGSGLGDGAAAARAALNPTPQHVPGIDGLVSVVAIPDPNAPGGQRLQVTGTIASRRIPTPEEVAAINAQLGTPAPNAPPPPPPLPEPPAAAPAPPPTFAAPPPRRSRLAIPR
jgi:spore germination cell wall hydrolase CwlJ-like protein